MGVGEAAYLTRQAQLAKQAISQTLGEMTGAAGRAVDPRLWTQHYPWATLGAMAVAGFVTTSLLVPSKEQQALKRLAAIERALNPSPPPPAPPARDSMSVDGNGKAPSGEHAYKAGKQGIGRAILGEVIGALKPAVVSLLTAGVTAATTKPSHEDMKAAAHAADAERGGAGPFG